ncbi:MAG: DUF3616 domain-containing protein [Pseudonocardia sp.]
MNVEGQVELRFSGHVVRTGNHVNLSAVRTEGEYLWLAGDETATVERLIFDAPDEPTRADGQRSFALDELVDLPGPPEEEADIEGIARSGGWLWAVGSHSLVRKRVKRHHDEAKALRRLAKVRREPNRFVIARLAVQPGADGHPELVRESDDGRRSAIIGAAGTDNLTDLLVDDVHLAPFLAIPSKDNGVDVEGLAVHGQTLYIGLRGPVLRGWAVVLEVLPREGTANPRDPGQLEFGELPEGTRYRKHFLDLGGLGVRDLCPDGDDLLVLAGPSMALSGPVRVYRWHGAAATETSRVIRGNELTLETEVFHGAGADHAEGIALLGDGSAGRARTAGGADAAATGTRLLVVYDSPAPGRRPTPESVLADRIRIGAPLVAPDDTPDSPPVTAMQLVVSVPLPSVPDH